MISESFANMLRLDIPDEDAAETYKHVILKTFTFPDLTLHLFEDQSMVALINDEVHYSECNCTECAASFLAEMTKREPDLLVEFALFVLEAKEAAYAQAN